MSDEPNPYAPPARMELVDVPHAFEPASHGEDEGLVGEYMLLPEDSRAALKARRSKYAWMAWTVAIAVAIANIVFGVGSSDMTRALMVPAMVALMFFMLRVWMPRAVGRAVERLGEEQRRLRFALSENGVRIVDGAGTDTRMKWASYKGWFEGPDRMFLQLASGSAHVVPRRAFSREGDFERVRDLVKRHLEPAKANAAGTRRLGGRALILWVVLILIFVAVWNFFSDVPRAPVKHPTSATAKSSD